MFIINPFAVSDARAQDTKLELKDMLSWTESEIDFGHNNFVSFEPGQDLVKVNAANDWDALVLYVRKEEILRNQAAGESKTQEPTRGGVRARTFVHGHDRNGEAKWRKVPLRIISDKMQPILAKSTSVPATSSHQGQPLEIPPELNFGDDHNSQVHALLRSNVQEANNKAKPAPEATNKQTMPKIGTNAPSKTPTAADTPDKEQPSSEDSVCDSKRSTKLLLTKEQTIKALHYLNKVKKLKVMKPTDGPAIEKTQTTEKEALPKASMQEILEKHNPKRKLMIDEDDQTALLNHACGLRNFCTSAPNQHQILQVDDHEILFSIDDSEQMGPPPISAIEIQEQDLDESVLTEPTLAKQEKMSRVVLTLLKTMQNKKNAAQAVSPDRTRLATLPEEPVEPKDSGHKSSKDEDDEDRMGGKAVLDSLVIQPHPTEDDSVEVPIIQQHKKELDESPATKVPRTQKAAANAAKMVGKFALLSPSAKKAVSQIQKNIQMRRDRSVQNFTKNFTKTPITKKEDMKRADLELRETTPTYPEKYSEKVENKYSKLLNETRSTKDRFMFQSADGSKLKIPAVENSKGSSERIVVESREDREDDELRSNSSTAQDDAQHEIDDGSSGVSSYEGVAAVEVDYIKNENRRRGRFNKNRKFGSKTPRNSSNSMVSSESESMQHLGSMTIQTGIGQVVSSIPPTRNTLTAPLSFDEQKVVDRMAREQSNLSCTSYDSSATEDMKEQNKGWRANRKGLGAILGINSKTSSVPLEQSERLEKVVVEVGNNDNTIIEEFPIVSPRGTEEVITPRRKRSVGKILKQKLKGKQLSSSRPTFSEKRPSGIDTNENRNSIITNSIATNGKTIFSDDGIRCSFVPSGSNRNQQMVGFCTQGGPPSPERIPRPLRHPDLPFSPTEYSQRPLSPTSETYTGTYYTRETRESMYSGQTGYTVEPHVTRLGFSTPCGLMNMSLDYDEYDDGFYSFASGSQGENDAIEVGTLRNEAEENTTKPSDQNQTTQPMNSFFSRLMAPTTNDHNAKLGSALDPPAAADNSYSFMSSFGRFAPSLINPSPPPPGSPRRRRSRSPRKPSPSPPRKPSSTYLKSILKPTRNQEHPPPPPPEPSPPTRSKRRSKQRSDTTSSWGKVRSFVPSSSSFFPSHHRGKRDQDTLTLNDSDSDMYPEIFSIGTTASDGGREMIMMDGAYAV